MKEQETKMKNIFCPNCKRDICKTNGHQICFDLSAGSVCLEIDLKVKYERLICVCGERIKIWKVKK